MTRDEQFKMIEAAERRMFDWSHQSAIPLYHIEVIVPFVETDFSLHVCFFLTTDEQVRSVGQEQWKSRLGGEYLGILKSLGYSKRWLPEVTFEVDSHENVERNFKGSYFYRMR